MKRPDSAGNFAGADRGRRRYAVDWAQREGAVDDLLGELDRRSNRRRRAGVAFGLMATLLIGGFIWRSAIPPVAEGLAPAVATVASPPRQVLPDGSVVELNDGAQIEVAFTHSVRRVLLRQGEAHFQVAKDPLKPFIVEVGKLHVRATGTAFSVVWNRASAEVLVTEGSVAVEIPASAGGGTTNHAGAKPAENVAQLEAGSRVVVDTTKAQIGQATVESLPPPEIARRLAWRVPRLEFSATPLADAVALFNQYNEVQFLLDDAALGELRISGYLRADKIETFVRLLETDFGLRAERRGEREIVLRREG